MRPFRGQFEQATHAVVERLRKEGDRSIFWLDTSGWLNTQVDFEGRAEEQDFFLDGNSSFDDQNHFVADDRFQQRAKRSNGA